MKGKNANEPAIANLKELGIKAAEDLMTRLFPNSKVKYTIGEGIKVHVEELDQDDIMKLAAFARNQHMKVNLKRSGTGITVLVSLNKDSVTTDAVTKGS